MEKLLTAIIVNDTGNDTCKKIENVPEEVQIIYAEENNIKTAVIFSLGNYVTFINASDEISTNYFEQILTRVKNYVFDCCFINYNIDFNYIKPNKEQKDYDEYRLNKPLAGDYLWCYIYNREKLEKVIGITDTEKYNELVEEEFKIRDAITEKIYNHKKDGNILFKNKKLLLNNRKQSIEYKNVIYIGDGCNGLFNGYISWLVNIGKAFSSKYNITIIYDIIIDETLKRLSKYFTCVKNDPNINYICTNLSCTYATYYYPRNIIYLNENYMFIHGNMSDYENSRVFTDDIYTRYIAVSEISKKKAKGYFPTDNIECIYNPYVLDRDELKPHLRLVSAQRYSPEKRTDRIIKMAKMLDELNIPYTWNLFTDKEEGTNINGLIFRNRIENVIDYVADSDYFVVLSDSEAMPYCMLEALSVETKIIATPLDVCNELDIVDGKNGFIIPFDYFNDGNEEQLKEKVKQIYENKNIKYNYKYDESKYDGFNQIFLN